MKKGFVLIFALIFGLTATVVLAANLQNAFPTSGGTASGTASGGTGDMLNPTAGGAGYNLTSNTVEPLINTIITVVLSFLGVVFFVLMIYAGWLYMTSSGDDKKVKAAKDLIWAAIGGFVVIIAAYAITAFVGGRFGSISLK